MHPSPLFLPSSPSSIPGGGERKWGHLALRWGNATDPGLWAIRGPGGCRGQRHRSPCSTMTQSCRPSGPALASILLTVLLGGEWATCLSIHPSLGIHSCFSTYALDLSGPLLLTGRGGWDGETHFQRRRLRFRVVRGPGNPGGGSVGALRGLQSQMKLRPSCALAGGGGRPLFPLRTSISSSGNKHEGVLTQRSWVGVQGPTGPVG